MNQTGASKKIIETIVTMSATIRISMTSKYEDIIPSDLDFLYIKLLKLITTGIMIITRIARKSSIVGIINLELAASESRLAMCRRSCQAS